MSLTFASQTLSVYLTSNKLDSPLHFGQTLRVLRTTAGLSLRELARQIDVSAAYLSQVETGKVPPPQPSRIQAIETSLGVPEGYLLSSTDRLDSTISGLLHDAPVVIDFLRTAIHTGLEPSDFQDLIELLNARGVAGLRLALEREPRESFSDDCETDIRHLSDYLLEDRIMCLRSAADKDSLFGELASAAAQQIPGLRSEEVCRELWAVEREASTGIGSGIAVPHLTHPMLDKTMVFLAVLDHGVDYSAIDGEPVDICFLLLAPDSARREHLELLARIAQVCSHPSFTQGVRAGDTPSEILKFVTQCATRIP